MEKNGDVQTPVYTSNSKWNVWDNDSSYWSWVTAHLSRQGEYLYFHDNLNLYAMRMTDDEPVILYTYDGGNGYLYGAMVYEDGTAHLNINTSPIMEDDSYITVNI